MSTKRALDIRNAMRAVTSHPEAACCAVVAALIGLAFVRTDWTPYSRQPHEIMDRVAKTQTVLGQSVWPERERKRFLKRDVALVVRERERDDDRLVPTGVFTNRPGRFLKLQEPELEPVRHLIATPGRVLIELRPVGSTTPATVPEVKNREVEPWLDELRRRGSGRNHRESVRAMPGDNDVMSPDDLPLFTGPVAREGRGYPFVAIRGLFDVSAQVAAIAEAVLRHKADAGNLLQLIDFYLERQTFDRKRNAWRSWEPVDVQVFRDLALAANGFERDVVPSSVTDAVITGPLPMRITGRWQTLATHPLLQSGLHSPGELEREANYLEAVLELQYEARLPRRTAATRRRGFTDLIRDPRTLEEDLFEPLLSAADALRPPRSSFGFQARRADTSRQNATIEELVRKIAEKMNPKQADWDLREWIRGRMTQEAGRQVLFRYFDFNVEPGATYRYQVRLELRNPSFGRPLAAASAAHVVEGETRLTPWSEPTAPVTVRRNVHYYLAGLEHSRHRQHPRARMTVFQYDTELGTVVQQELPVELGQPIAGTAKTLLLDPAAEVKTEADYEFRSRDTLLDALPDLLFDRELHPNLQLPPGSLGAAHIPDYALVLTDDALRTIDPRSQADELARQELYLRLQREQLQHLRSEADEAEGWEDEQQRMMFEELFGQPGVGEAQQQPQPRRLNMLQRR